MKLNLDYDNLPRYLTRKEAAAMLRVSLDGYYRHIHPAVSAGEIKSYTIGRKRLILTSSLLAWHEQHEQKAA